MKDRELLKVGWILLAFSVASCSSLSDFETPKDLPEVVEFNRDIRPVLSDKCYACHGPDAGARKAKLRLDQPAAVTVQREGYDQPAIVPGSPRSSALVARILHEDPGMRMPPPQKDAAGSGGKLLTQREKGLLIKWIEQGAIWDIHWSYKPLKRPTVPIVDSPDVGGAIDKFILARLKGADLEPSSEADRTTLIRRLSLDLLGLPPSVKEIDDFLEDPLPEAYEKIVNRLLASPHFGEKMALTWLDLVRYADTMGYHSDVHRRIWPYRDWVIQAFNSNKPFDEFTRDQLAGDLLPKSGREEKIASAFNRLGQTSKEGGSQSKEYLAKYAADRVRTVSTTWLGSTVACAECHDHKFDPFSQKDFYSLAAFFADIKEMGLYLNSPFMYPERPLPPRPITDREKRELKQIEDRLRDLYTNENVQLTQLTKEEIKKEVERLQPQMDRLSDILHVSVVTESVEPRMTRLLPRGNWQDDSGAVVLPNVPGFLPPMEVSGRRANRTDLAEWIVSPENPLTARVFVNRLWKELFGIAISDNTGDLGSQGDWPTHPELLDWLASEFMESGWDVKQLVKEIVMSATYRQSSIPDEEMEQKDPENRLFARQSRFRLKAELVRDTALSVSGLLNREIGGPSIKPYQPEGYWEDIETFGVLGPGSKWENSSGKDQYRRGVYVYWKRTFLHPALKAFDAPERQECTSDRPTSNTPLQALVLLNDPTFVEAARVLAQNAMYERFENNVDRLTWIFRRAVSRAPTQVELFQLQTLFDKQLVRYQKNPNEAKKLVRVGQSQVPSRTNRSELAAWTVVCRAILNLHETITRS